MFPKTIKQAILSHKPPKTKMVIDRLLTFCVNIFLLFFPGRTRTKDKYRVVYSDHQRLELEKEFHYSRYITIRRKAELANSVGLSERQVRISLFFRCCRICTQVLSSASYSSDSITLGNLPNPFWVLVK